MAKKGTNFCMKVKVDYDFDLIEKILIKFKQKDRELLFSYPSDKVLLSEEEGEDDVLVLLWTIDDTFVFNADETVGMDTFIELTDADTNPQTAKCYFKFADTLFSRKELP